MSVEVRVLDHTESFLRNYVEVIAGFHSRDGFVVERVEPMLGVHEDKPVVLGWQANQRLLPQTELTTLGDDPVAFRVHRAHVREAGLALLAFADGDGGGPPGDAAALRRDLDRERDRADRLEFALLEALGRMTPIISGSHSLVPSKVPTA